MAKTLNGELECTPGALQREFEYLTRTQASPDVLNAARKIAEVDLSERAISAGWNSIAGTNKEEGKRELQAVAADAAKLDAAAGKPSQVSGFVRKLQNWLGR